MLYAILVCFSNRYLNWLMKTTILSNSLIIFIYGPTLVIGLLERLCATVFVRSYEHSRHWIIYVFAQGLGIVVVQYEHDLVQSGEYTNTAKNIQLALSVIICLCLIALFFVNRQLTLSSRHRSKLTVRYQLAENVKALRAFVPFVVVDNCVSIMFVISMIFFQVDSNFDIAVCRNVPNYTISFAVFRAIRNVLGMNITGTEADYFTQLKAQWHT
uniref:Uncharacterized protein n=1 Tax=Caenorhabditis japonica TaxID=281687 RepID=A0A8R1HGM1_CAEJA